VEEVVISDPELKVRRNKLEKLKLKQEATSATSFGSVVVARPSSRKLGGDKSARSRTSSSGLPRLTRPPRAVRNGVTMDLLRPARGAREKVLDYFPDA
jgi:hypothetical protein